MTTPALLRAARADEGAPSLRFGAIERLRPGVYRRIVAGAKQIYIRVGGVREFWEKCGDAGFPAGAHQPLAVQVAVLQGWPVEEVVCSEGRCLWSDDLVVAPEPEEDDDEDIVSVFVSASGIGERPMEAPGQPPRGMEPAPRPPRPEPASSHRRRSRSPRG